MSGFMDWLNPISGIMSGLGSAAGGVMDYFAQQDANKQNMAMFQQSRQDAATAVQTRAKDMAAAGINPLLAAGSPASVQSAPQLPALPAGNMARGLGQAPLALAQTKLSLESQEADNRLKNANASFAEQTVKDRVRGAIADAQVAVGTAESRIQQGKLNNLASEAGISLTKLQADLVAAQTANTKASTSLTNVNTDLASQQYKNNLTKLPNDAVKLVYEIRKAGLELAFLQDLQKKYPLADIEGIRKILEVGKEGAGVASEILGGFFKGATKPATKPATMPGKMRPY